MNYISLLSSYNLGFCFLLILFMATAVFADSAADQHNLILEDILEEIRNTQEVDSNAGIILEKVSDDYLVKLGETVTLNIYPDPPEQERLKILLEKESAEQQQQELHKLLGYRYIESGFDLNISRDMLENWMQGKGAVTIDDFNSEDKSDEDYHPGFGTVLFFLALLIIIIIINIFSQLKKKPKLQANSHSNYSGACSNSFFKV